MRTSNAVEIDDGAEIIGQEESERSALVPSAATRAYRGVRHRGPDYGAGREARGAAAAGNPGPI